jgi:hypothetical protein
MGIPHRGVFCDIADAAMGIAYASTLEGGETLAILELKINSQAYLASEAACDR